MMKWEKHLPIVKLFMTDEKRTFLPKVMKLFGKENFTIKDGVVFLSGKEIVADPERKREIIEAEEDKYGGQTKAYERLSRKFVGISRRDVQKVYQGSERRQLKARYQKQKKGSNFIRANRPGHVEIDITFYRGQKLPVFGAIDVFSRYAYYKRIPDKKAASLLVVLKEFMKKFEAISKFKIFKVSTDSGSEFQKSFTKFLEEQSPRVFYDRQVKSRKLIENLNASLRHYVERVGWDTINDLDKLIENFTETYNDSKHSTTKKIPNEMIKIDPKSVVDDRKNDGKEGFAMAKLEKGDKVRLYDPRRVDVKEEMKERLKGKIKLSNDDYVKKFTSFHRGNAPHWTKKLYTIKGVQVGKRRATRYLLVEKKGFFFRHELQKSAPVTKVDPRKKVIEKRKEVTKKIEAAKPKPIRAAKYLGKEVIAHFSTEKEPETDDPAVVLEIYKGYIIALFKSEYLSWLSPKEIVKINAKTYKKSKVNEWKEENSNEIANARKEIDEEIEKIEKQAKE